VTTGRQISPSSPSPFFSRFDRCDVLNVFPEFFFFTELFLRFDVPALAGAFTPLPSFFLGRSGRGTINSCSPCLSHLLRFTPFFLQTPHGKILDGFTRASFLRRTTGSNAGVFRPKPALLSPSFCTHPRKRTRSPFAVRAPFTA